MKITFLKVVLLLMSFVGALSLTYAQTVSGTVLDSDGFPVVNAEVSVANSTETTLTDDDGNFSFQVPAGKGLVEIFTAAGQSAAAYNVAAGATQTLGVINMKPSLSEVVAIGRGVIDVEEGRRTPVAVNTIFRDEIQEKAQGNVEFPEILKNTPSVYVSNQAGGFGDSQVFTRGFDQTNTAFLLNGQPINGMEDGRMYWSNWSGMTEIANAVQIQRGLGSSKLAISSVGGTVNIITKATEKRKGGYVQLIGGNDSYIKGAAGYNTGIGENGWALSVAVSHWQAHRKFAAGTKGQGQNYFLSIGKKINDNHNLNFLITGAPQWHDQNFSKSLDLYDQYGIKYNNNFGFYNDGTYQTLRRNYYHKPVSNLNWDWTINDKASLSTVIYASVGRGGGTGGYGTGYRTDAEGLYDWSRIETENDAIVAPAQVVGGQNLPAGFTGGNYGYLYYNDLGDVDNNGNLNRQRSGLIIRSSVNNHFWYGGVTNLNYDINENLSFNVGADVRFYKGDHFRQVNDFLGLDGYYDNVGFSQRGLVTQSFEANPWTALTDFADEDQRINYDNSENINYQGAFGQLEYGNDTFTAFIQGSVSNQSYKKEDRYNFDSPKVGDQINKNGYNVKGGASFNINNYNTIYANAGFYSRQPFLDNIYANNQYDATLLIDPAIDNEEITGLEAGYRFKSNNTNFNVNLYYTTWDNRSLVSFGVDNNGTPTNTADDIALITQDTGVRQEHKGVEVDFNTKATSFFTVRGYLSYGDWNIVDGFQRRVFNDDTNALISDTDVVLVEDLKVTQAPQFSFGTGFIYEITKGISFDADFNYYARNYDRSLEDNSTLEPFALVDAGLTYKFKLGSNKFKFRGNVYNLLDSEYLNQADAFGYFYGNGRTWNAGLTMNF